MSILNPATSYSFLNLDAMRQASAERVGDDAVAANLRQAAEQSRLAAGTTITARYQYKVAADGSLVPVSTQITTSAPEELERYANRNGGRRAPTREEERNYTLKDFARPKAALSPEAETTLFESFAAAAMPQQEVRLATQYSLSPIQNLATTPVQDESGEMTEAEVLAPASGDGVGEGATPFAPRAQIAVAGLYARNYSITYSMEPLAEIAA